MILVTGAGGTVGRMVVERLSTARARFRTGHSTEKKAAAASRAGLDATVCDFSRPDTIARALEGIDRLFLLCGGRRDQTELEIAAVRAARASRIERIVKISVWDAPSESFAFARVHRPVEREIEACGIAWTFLRPNGFFQNLMLDARTIRIPGGVARISHVDVRDIAEVAVRCLVDPGLEGRAFALSGPDAWTWGEIADRLSAVLGRSVRYVNVGEDEARAGMLASGAPPWYVEQVLDLCRFYRAGGAAAITDDVRRILGRPARSLDDWLADEVRSRGQVSGSGLDDLSPSDLTPKPDPETD